MIKNIWLISFFIFLVSCNNKEEHYYPTGELFSIVEIDNEGRNNGYLTEMYKSGEIKKRGNYVHGNKNGLFKIFFKNGNLKAVEKYKDNVWLDTTKIYDKNGLLEIIKYKRHDKVYFIKFNKKGNIITSGELKDSLLIGWCNYYYDTGVIKNKIEYYIIDNKQYINQNYHFNKKGEVVDDKSNYLILDFPDTIPSNKLVVGSLDLKQNSSMNEDFFMVYFKYFDRNQKYNAIKLDSTYGRSKEKAILWCKFKTIGDKILKGYVLKKKRIIKSNKKDSTMVDIVTSEYKIYFKKHIYVKDKFPLQSIYEYQNKGTN